MSDPKSSYGEPVEEPGNVDDVVGRANEGLAEAEAARRDAAARAAASEEADAPESADATAARADAADTSEDAGPSAAASAPAAPAEAEPDPWESEEAAALDYRSTPSDTAVYSSADDDAPTVVHAPVVTPSEPVAETAVAGPAYAPQPIFVQAPEAPRPRGNRGAAGAIGLLAALAFAVLYFAAWMGFGALAGDVTGDNVGTTALEALGTWSLWVPVIVFFLAFWLLGAIINRGRWGAWVVLGLLVGIAAYGGHILGALFQAPFWMLTASEGAQLVGAELLAPLAIAAFVIGRELTIWFGAWVAARGKRVTELNLEAQREYERTLEAGPQLVRQ
ncbi:ABC transporter [Microbacterium sp. HD4P20]|uniref:ABC transporter n=1 Tax=Microbacterium sp. HD4P20 TaxID=2864874 RepID=UPI001C63BE44|nr:ABC transporter [Microbacterium sp. HD4P20]MCP2638035.1 ABC transporter [Microbacterium sp. HD4P20]